MQQGVCVEIMFRRTIFYVCYDQRSFFRAGKPSRTRALSPPPSTTHMSIRYVALVVLLTLVGATTLAEMASDYPLIKDVRERLEEGERVVVDPDSAYVMSCAGNAYGKELYKDNDDGTEVFRGVELTIVLGNPDDPDAPPPPRKCPVLRMLSNDAHALPYVFDGCFLPDDTCAFTFTRTNTSALIYMANQMQPKHFIQNNYQYAAAHRTHNMGGKNVVRVIESAVVVAVTKSYGRGSRVRTLTLDFDDAERRHAEHLAPIRALFDHATNKGFVAPPSSSSATLDDESII